jgi:hypothetical protein
MDDPSRVRGREPSPQLKTDVYGFVHGQPSHCQPSAQRFTLEAFRHQVRCAAVVADIVNSQHIAVIERARGASFLQEAPHPLGIVREIGKQHLDCDVSAEPFVTRAPHFAHPSRSQQLIDSVRAKTITSAKARPVVRDPPRQDVERGCQKKLTRVLRRCNQ